MVSVGREQWCVCCRLFLRVYVIVCVMVGTYERQETCSPFGSDSRSDHEPSSANHNAAFPSDGIDIITTRHYGLRACVEGTWTETGRLFVNSDSHRS